YLLGRVAQLENKPQDALAKYQDAFKKEPERADEATMRLGIDLLKLLLEEKWKVDIRGKPGADADSIVKEAEKLAKLADDVPMYRGGVYGLAAQAHLNAVNPEEPQQRQSHRKAALDKLKVAVQATPKEAPDGWRW